MENKKLVYVVCPNKKEPIGGIKQLYRLVDSLNLAGYNAFIIHGKHNFRINWFDNQTPIKYFPNLFALLYNNTRKKKKLKVPLFIKQLFISNRMPEPESIIVFPEIYGPAINDLVPNNKIVIFNQNCYYSFDRFELLKKQPSPYNNPNTLGCMVVSDDSLNYLKYSFPNLFVSRIRLGISQCFQYSDKKKKQIAFMPRKLSEDFTQLFNIITNRIELKDWSFIAIDNMTELEVANVLKESAVFLSFNHREGFGLPPVEAMACGCYVIGYTGNGGKEYFNNKFCSPIENRNIIEFAKEIEAIIKEYEINPTKILEQGKQASDYVLANYNVHHETEDIINTWNQLTVTP
jgi:hypothetical protein